MNSWSPPRRRFQGRPNPILPETTPHPFPRRRRRREPPGKARAVPAAGACPLPGAGSSQVGLVTRRRCTVASSSSAAVLFGSRLQRRRLCLGGLVEPDRRGGAVLAARTRWPRSGPYGPGRVGFCTPSAPPGVGRGGEAPSRRVAAAMAYVQQCGGEDFAGLGGARPGQRGLVCPCCCVRSAPADGGGGSPPGGSAAAILRFKTFLPPSTQQVTLRT